MKILSDLRDSSNQSWFQSAKGMINHRVEICLGTYSSILTRVANFPKWIDFLHQQKDFALILDWLVFLLLRRGAKVEIFLRNVKWIARNSRVLGVYDLSIVPRHLLEGVESICDIFSKIQSNQSKTDLDK